MRGVDSGGAEIDEPGLVAVGGPDVPGPIDRLVGHVGGEVIALFRRFRLRDPGRIAVDRGIILVGLALVEAIEIVEPEAGGPAVERPGGGDVGLGRVVPLAEDPGGVAVVPQDLRDERGALWDHAGVAGIAGAHLDDDAGRGGVVIPAGEERGPRRRTERGGVKTIVLEPVVGELLEVWRRDRPSEGRAHAEPHVVEQDQQDVGAALGRFHRPRIIGRRILVSPADLALKLRVGLGQLGRTIAPPLELRVLSLRSVDRSEADPPAGQAAESDRNQRGKSSSTHGSSLQGVLGSARKSKSPGGPSGGSPTIERHECIDAGSWS